MNRRQFVHKLGALTSMASAVTACRSFPRSSDASAPAQPIVGSWISIWWDDRRHFYWNDTCLQFSAEQWELAVKEVADIGFKYLVLLAVAKGGKAFYDTPLLPKLPAACDDPINALLRGGDKYGVKFFISSDWYGDWDDAALLDGQRMATRFAMMGEIAERYGSHKSFYGWYWPNEACISPYFSDSFISHVNACTAEARRLMPRTRTLTAPCGTKNAVCDDNYVRQLEALDVDIIAYQDEVGCLRMDPGQSARAFSRLRLAHDRVPQRALWADVEVFSWEGPANAQTSPLVPAEFPRVLRQLEAVSPFVEKTLIYQYQGLMNRQGTRALAGHPDSTRLYSDYVRWLKRHHPAMIGSLRRYRS